MEGRKLEAQGSALILPTRPGPSTHACLGSPGGHPALLLTSPRDSQVLSLLSSTAQTSSVPRPWQGTQKRALDQSLDRPPFLRSESLRVWKRGCPALTSAASALGEVISFSKLPHEKTSLQVGDWQGTAQSETPGRRGEQLGEQCCPQGLRGAEAKAEVSGSRLPPRQAAAPSGLFALTCP